MRAILVRVNARALVNSYKNPTVSGASIRKTVYRSEISLSISISIGRRGENYPAQPGKQPRPFWQAARGLRGVARNGTIPVDCTNPNCIDIPDAGPGSSTETDLTVNTSQFSGVCHRQVLWMAWKFPNDAADCRVD